MKRMGLVILILLLLALLHLSTPCNAAANKATFHRFKASKLNPAALNQTFGADKRKVHTGPNPLHNR